MVRNNGTGQVWQDNEIARAGKKQNTKMSEITLEKNVKYVHQQNIISLCLILKDTAWEHKN